MPFSAAAAISGVWPLIADAIQLQKCVRARYIVELNYGERHATRRHQQYADTEAE
jgi:hypothetical protein